LIVLHKDGKFKVMNIPDKLFVGRFTEAFIVNKEQVYSVIYKENKSNLFYHKRCKIDKFIVDKEYTLCPDKCKIELFETNYSIVLDCELEDTARSKGQAAELIFDDIPIRSASAKGFKTANRPINKFIKKKRGTEKPPEELNADATEKEEPEEETKKVQGWKSKAPIRFIASEPIIEEEPEEDVVQKNSKELYLKMGREENSREIPIPEPLPQEESVTQVDEAKNAEGQETREIPTPDPLPQEEKSEEEDSVQLEETDDVDEQPEATDSQDAEEEDTSSADTKQAELDLPQEKGTRRYLIDEDNPFMLEP
jgi:topoisomerase-4 subunit A